MGSGNGAIRARRERVLTGVAAFSGALLLASCGGGGEAANKPPADLAKLPANVRWVPYQGMALPQSDDGPQHDDATTSSSFKRSPQGAAVAAIVHNAHVSLAPDNTWARVMAVEVAPGPGRDEWAVSRAVVSNRGIDKKALPRLLGYKFHSYSDTRAETVVFVELSDRSRAGVRVTVVWQDEDWRLLLPDKTSTQRPVEAIDQVPGDAVRLEAPVR